MQATPPDNVPAPAASGAVWSDYAAALGVRHRPARRRSCAPQPNRATARRAPTSSRQRTAVERAPRQPSMSPASVIRARWRQCHDRSINDRAERLEERLRRRDPVAGRRVEPERQAPLNKCLLADGSQRCRHKNRAAVTKLSRIHVSRLASGSSLVHTIPSSASSSTVAENPANSAMWRTTATSIRPSSRSANTPATSFSRSVRSTSG